MTVRMDKAIVRLVDAKDGKEMTVEAEVVLEFQKDEVLINVKRTSCSPLLPFKCSKISITGQKGESEIEMEDAAIVMWNTEEPKLEYEFADCKLYKIERIFGKLCHFEYLAKTNE